MEDEMYLVIRSATAAMKQLWEEIGLDEEAQKDRAHILYRTIETIFKELEDEERARRDNLFKQIYEYGHRIEVLSAELNIGSPADVPEDSKPIELYSILEKEVRRLNDIVKERQLRIDELQEEEKELCSILAEKPLSLPKKRVPSEEDLVDLERQIRTLVQEKDHRKSTFRQLKSSIQHMMQQLERSPSTSFEQSVLSDVEDLFVFSLENIQQMKVLHAELEAKCKSIEKEMIELKEKILLLWERLKIDKSERHLHDSSLTGYTPSSLKILQQQHEQLEELKHQNMEKFIAELRRELEIWWDKCYCGEEERKGFAPYYEDVYSEEALYQHDTEVKRLKSLYNSNIDIFELFEKHQKLWIKLEELEGNANNPNRLFGNRGCRLLQEEKERNWVKKTLPQIEKTLDEMVLKWELDHGKVFQIRGTSLTDFIRLQWEEYNHQKLQERQERHNAKVKQLVSESRLGTRPPIKRRIVQRSESMHHSKLRRQDENGMLKSRVPSGFKSPGQVQSSVLREHNVNSGTDSSSRETSTYSQFSILKKKWVRRQVSLRF
ncbi:protein regulator of cytokinesis 1-like isoform X2 [Oratosquilla oratoria]|uniref:protein regulator of cytokinesis 1-like isoform X2 n=1 Tax=Oratosquilla oratoria TaxID=337810 RepID=UPI003F76E475